MHQQENTRIYLFLLLIISLFFSSYLGENSSGGSKLDYRITRPFIDNFNISLASGFEYFVRSNQIQSPFFYILVSFLEKFFGTSFIKYFYILISSLIPYIFYISLKKKFRKTCRSYLFFISLIIFLSPYFRSSSAWITTDNFALLFFILSISKYLNIKKDGPVKETILCLTYLGIATYIRQYYVIFFLFYFVKFYSLLNIKKILFTILYLLILFLPLLIYYYYFFSIQKLPNISDDNDGKLIFIISNFFVFLSLYFFYTLPFYLNSILKIKKISLKKTSICLFLFLIFLFLSFNNIISFDKYGGGIIFKISKIIKFELLFYISAFFGLLLLLFNFNKNNLIVYFCIIFAFPVTVIYQKYFDPLLILSLTTITVGGQLNKIIREGKLNLFVLFSYFSLFLIATNFHYN